jgi:MoaA/NifB/PqqE/SkfB family radical SAM enzyme
MAALKPRPLIAMTTNGVGLGALAAPLASAGLGRVNVSLDTIDQQEFFKLAVQADWARPARRRRGGSEGSARSWADCGQGQRGGDARHQRPQRR